MNITFKLNHSIGGKLKGDTINLACDKEGIPLDHYWRRRLAESKEDNCMELVKEDETKHQYKIKKEDKKED